MPLKNVILAEKVCCGSNISNLSGTLEFPTKALSFNCILHWQALYFHFVTKLNFVHLQTAELTLGLSQLEPSKLVGAVYELKYKSQRTTNSPADQQNSLQQVSNQTLMGDCFECGFSGLQAKVLIFFFRNDSILMKAETIVRNTSAKLNERFIKFWD